jgi:dimethylamine/trimethylamine dehydrogenase
VNVYRDSLLAAPDILDMGFTDIVIATGAAWRRDGVARFHTLPINLAEGMPVFTPDDIMDGKIPDGHVVLYDDDHYYMGSVLAELLVARGAQVTYVTPSTKVSEWSTNTLEQALIQQRLLELGVEVVVSHALISASGSHARVACTYTGRERDIACDAILLVTARLPNDALYTELLGEKDRWPDCGIGSVKVVGDAQAPAAIAWATYAGHRYAEEFDEADRGDSLPFRREVAGLKP